MTWDNLLAAYHGSITKKGDDDVLLMTNEMMRKIKTESLQLLIKDARERIQSNPDHEWYVRDQKELICKCLEILDERGVRA